MEPSSASVEVTSFFQIPSFHIVGLPSTEVLESRERVRGAVESSGLEFPRRRVLVNLAPSGVKKGGTLLDLPIALAVLSDADPIAGAESVTGFACGELGLSGEVRGSGFLLRAWSAAWREGAQFLLCPAQEKNRESECRNLLESAKPYAGPLPAVYFASTLQETWAWVLEKGWMKPQALPAPYIKKEETYDPGELLPLSGLLQRTLLAALIGDHSFLWLGAKGIGKTHAFRWAKALQPEANPQIQLEQAWLHELSDGIPRSRVFREVGTQVKPAALLGSLGLRGELRVGELGLAHGGILFADEFPEWPRDARECLRHPLESGMIHLSRAQGKHVIPSRIQLLANGNLCPCGAWGNEDSAKKCRCSPLLRKLYLDRLSGPVLDRLDGVLRLQMPRIPPKTLDSQGIQALREKLSDQIANSRRRALQRYGELPSRLPLREVEPWLGSGADRLASLRSRHRAGRLALTFALLDGESSPKPRHLDEAVSLRPEHQGFGD